MKSCHEQNMIPKYNEGKERCGDQIKSSTQGRKLVSIPCEKSHMHILCKNKNKSTSVPLYSEMYNLPDLRHMIQSKDKKR